MAFPTVQSVTGTAFGTAATSFAIAMPATVNAGDLLIIMFAKTTGTNNTTPAGFTDIIAGSGSNFISFAAKAADGTEGGTTKTWTTNSSTKAAALVYRITGWRNSGTIVNDVEVSNPASGTSSAPNPPSFDPTNWATEDTLWLAVGSLNASTTVSVYPGSYSNGQVQASGGSGGASTKQTVAAAERGNTVSSEDPGNFSFGSSAAWAASTIAIRPAAAGTAYTQSLSGTLDFVGSQSKATRKPITAGLSFSGTFSHIASMFRSLTGGLSFVGGFTHAATMFRSLTGGLSFVGSINAGHLFVRTLTATLSFVGSIPSRTIGKKHAATLSFTGSVNKFTSYPLSAALSFVGGVTRRTSTTRTATLSFVGSATKRTGKSLAGGLSFIGSIPSRAIGKLHTAALSFVGNATKKTSRTQSAGLSFSGTMSKATSRALTAALSFVGAISSLKSGGGGTAYTLTLTAALSFTGALNKMTARSLAAILDFRSFLSRPGDTFWGRSGGALDDTVNSHKSPHIFVMADGTELLVYGIEPSTQDSAQTVYQLKVSGSVGAPAVFNTGGVPAISVCTRNGDTVYVLVGATVTSEPARLHKLAYSAGSVVVSSVNVGDTAARLHGIYYDPTNSYIHTLTYDGDTTGLDTIRAWNSSLVQQYSDSTIGLSTETRLAALVGDGANVMYAWELSGSTQLKRIVAGASSYTITSETFPAVSSPFYMHGIYDNGFVTQFVQYGANVDVSRRTAASTWDSPATIITDGVSHSSFTVHKTLANNNLAVYYTKDDFSSNFSLWVIRRLGGTWGSPTSFREEFDASNTTDSYAASATADDLNSTNQARVAFAYNYQPTLVAVRTQTYPNFVLKALTATLNFIGSLGRQGMPVHLSATLSFVGNTTKKTARSLSGTLSFSGAISMGKFFARTLTAGLSFIGSMPSRRISRGLTGTLSFTGTFSRLAALHRTLTAQLSFIGTQTKQTRRGLTASLATSGSLLIGKFFSRIFTATLSFTGTMTTLYSRFIEVVEESIGKIVKLALIAAGVQSNQRYTPLSIREQANQPISLTFRKDIIAIRVVAPKVAEKIGTNVLIEATFTDKNGTLYDPDNATVIMYVKKPDATYYTGFDPSTETGTAMTKQSTGVYQATFQSLLTDPSGTWVFECQGKTGADKTFNDIKIQFRI